MLPFAYYLLKVIVCSVILYGYYWFFLRNKIFHIYNRFYLLATVALSMLLPLLKFNIWHKAETGKTGVVHLLQIVNSSDEYLDNIVIHSQYNHINKEQILFWLFVAACAVFAGILIRSIVKIHLLKKNNPNQHFENVNLVSTEDKSTPFSFFNDIFWNTAIDINSSNGQRILKHEIAHVQEKHSQDKLFINIVLVFFWCNPIFWLLRKELNIIHEFLADKKAVEDGDTSAFAAMILQTTYPTHQFEITNNFFYSPIKRRLAMLAKNNKTKVGYISRLLVLPLAVFIFAAFTLKAKKISALSKNDNPITVVLDAGHGGSDNGATTYDGTAEKDFNLALVKKIKELNTNPNIKIILTRETDIYQDPKEKANFAKENNADIFISVHGDIQTKVINENNKSLSVYVSKDNFENNINSKLLASAVINSFQHNYALPVATNPQQRQQGIWVLQANSFPSVLIEAGYLNNKKDFTYLKSEAGKTAFAKNILNAIADYAANKYTPNEYEAVADSTPPSVGLVVAKESNVTVLKNVTATIDSDNDFVGLYIINGREFSAQELIGKTIKSKIGKIYEKNNSEMLAKYGNKAANGVMIFEYARIEDSSPKINGEADSVYVVDASQRVDRKSVAKNMAYSDQTKPLYILDGKEISKREMNNISPNRIESVNVIKDDKAINKYGSRGKDGVVEITTKDSLPPKDDKIFTKVEDEAEFPGGRLGWSQYLQKNLNAATPVNEGWKEGTYVITVQFIVDKDGSISDIKTNDYPGSKTAEHCISLIKKGPKWRPATQNGHVVTSYRKQPITFVVSY